MADETTETQPAPQATAADPETAARAALEVAKAARKDACVREIEAACNRHNCFVFADHGFEPDGRLTLPIPIRVQARD